MHIPQWDSTWCRCGGGWGLRSGTLPCKSLKNGAHLVSDVSNGQSKSQQLIIHALNRWRSCAQRHRPCGRWWYQCLRTLSSLSDMNRRSRCGRDLEKAPSFRWHSEQTQTFLSLFPLESSFEIPQNIWDQFSDCGWGDQCVLAILRWSWCRGRRVRLLCLARFPILRSICLAQYSFLRLIVFPAC